MMCCYNNIDRNQKMCKLEEIMYKLCKTERSVKRQREIELAFLKLMETTPYDDITVTSLCTSIGIPRKAFYRYFDTKEDALIALIDHTLAECDVIISSNAPLRTRVENVVLFVKRQKPLLDVLAQNDLLAPLTSIAARMPTCKPDLLATIFPNEPERMRPILARFAASGFIFLVLDWHNNNFERTVGEMTDIVLRLLVRPIYQI